MFITTPGERVFRVKRACDATAYIMHCEPAGALFLVRYVVLTSQNIRCRRPFLIPFHNNFFFFFTRAASDSLLPEFLSSDGRRLRPNAFKYITILFINPAPYCILPIYGSRWLCNDFAGSLFSRPIFLCYRTSSFPSTLAWTTSKSKTVEIERNPF